MADSTVKALTTDKVVLPKEVSTVIAGKAKDTSTIAALSPAEPMKFVDQTYLVFTGNSRAEVVEEGAPKSSYEQEVPPVVGKRFTVQTTTRVSNQFSYADEDGQLEIIKAISEDQGQELGKALDYVVYHAIQPIAGTVMAGYSPLSAVAKQVSLGADLSSSTDAQMTEAFDKLSEAVNDIYDINGIAMSKGYAARLRRIRVPNSMARLYPDIPLNLSIGNFEGVNAATSGTVDGRYAATPTGVLAFIGDYSMIRWGYVRDIQAEIIPMGNPDGLGDLKRYNQIAYRTEATYSYAIIDPNAFAVLKSGNPSSTRSSK